MPPRNFIVRVPAPSTVSTISGVYPWPRRRWRPSGPLYFAAMCIIPLTAYVNASSHVARRNVSEPRLSNLYFAWLSGVSSGKPSSAHCFHILRMIG